MLPISEAFTTIQGEAYWTGTPATFLRLQGCDVGCPWCDTKYTWHRDLTRLVPLPEVLAKTEANETFCYAEVNELVEYCRPRPRHVVITGGEPADYDLEPLTAGLMATGKFVQLETSGTAPIRVTKKTWVTVSPKLGMPGGKIVLTYAVDRANEIKFPVGRPADITALRDLLEKSEHAPSLVWLQPLSCSPKATALCVEAATENGWRVSIQTHKFMNVR